MVYNVYGYYGLHGGIRTVFRKHHLHFFYISQINVLIYTKIALILSKERQIPTM